MKENSELKKDVQDALDFEASLNALNIGVKAEDGIISLSGSVDSYGKKMLVENTAKKVAGVRAIVENIEITHFGTAAKTDPEIAKEVVIALKWDWQVPEEKIQIKVEKGWVSLEGELEWNYQKEAAKTAVNHLSGVKGISDFLEIRSEHADQIEKTEIRRALVRNGLIDDKEIQIGVSENHVLLKGTVHSIYEKEEAERIAWNVLGVWKVENELLVDYD